MRLDYVITALPETPVSPADFQSGSLDREILSRLELVIATEEPVTESLLVKRVRVSFGIKANGRLMRAKFDQLLTQLNPLYTTEQSGRVFWKTLPGADFDTYRVFPEGDPNRRYSSEIPAIEAAAAMRAMQTSKRQKKADLFTATARELGYTRKGSDVRALLDEAYALNKK